MGLDEERDQDHRRRRATTRLPSEMSQHTITRAANGASPAHGFHTSTNVAASLARMVPAGPDRHDHREPPAADPPGRVRARGRSSPTPAGPSSAAASRTARPGGGASAAYRSGSRAEHLLGADGPGQQTGRPGVAGTPHVVRPGDDRCAMAVGTHRALLASNTARRIGRHTASDNRASGTHRFEVRTPHGDGSAPPWSPSPIGACSHSTPDRRPSHPPHGWGVRVPGFGRAGAQRLGDLVERLSGHEVQLRLGRHPVEHRQHQAAPAPPSPSSWSRTPTTARTGRPACPREWSRQPSLRSQYAPAARIGGSGEHVLVHESMNGPTHPANRTSA